MSLTRPAAAVLLTGLLLAALWAPWPGSASLFALLVAAAPAVALLCAGIGSAGSGAAAVQASKRAVRWRAASALAAALLVIGGFVALVWVEGGNALATRLLGLPRALGIMVWLVAVAPLVVLGLLFGLAFVDRRPADERVARLRRLADRGDRDG
jgi:uncharacterized membrane protein